MKRKDDQREREAAEAQAAEDAERGRRGSLGGLCGSQPGRWLGYQGGWPLWQVADWRPSRAASLAQRSWGQQPLQLLAAQWDRLVG